MDAGTGIAAAFFQGWKGVNAISNGNTVGGAGDIASSIFSVVGGKILGKLGGLAGKVLSPIVRAVADGGGGSYVTVSDGVINHIWDQHGWGGAYHETAATGEDPSAMSNVFARGITKERLHEMIQTAIDNGDVVGRSSADTRGGYYIDYNFGDMGVGVQGQNGMRLSIDGSGNLTTAMPRWITGGAG